MSDANLAAALIPPRKVALYADGERVSDWVPLHADGSSGHMRLRETRSAQVWTFGISLTPDGPLTHVEVWPDGPQQSDVALPEFNTGQIGLLDDL